MKLRLGAAVLAVALSTLTAVTAAAPAMAGDVDITPPAVGSCHDLTWEEAYGDSEPLPAVPCTDPHTLVTTKVITFSEAPDWSSDAVATKVVKQCYRSEIDFFGGQRKSIQMSTYGIWYFYPTEAQRAAGALWARCDVGLYSTAGRGTDPTIKKLPTDGPPLLGAPPVDQVAKCRKGKRADYAVTTCDRGHALRVVKAVLYPADRYPGQKRINSWTNDKCSRALGRSFGYWSAPTKFLWGLKLRYSLCYRTTDR
jgi:hypothetical protein